MVKKINSVQELLLLTKKYSRVQIVGIGWIGKLTACYLKEYTRREFQCVDIGQENPVVENNNTIIIAEQEGYGEKLAEELSNNDLEAVFYLSDEVKNEMDTAVMTNWPDIYEKEVLIPRKRELDELMHLKFSESIKELLQEPQFPCFQSIEIETVNRCNGECFFCPVNRKDDSRQFVKMSETLFESIILQLSSINYQGKVNLFSNNEPLLDKRIFSFAKFAWEHLPNACKVIFTNGTLLKKESFLQLAQYLDIFCIDIYYDDDICGVLTSDLKEILRCCLTNTELQKKVMVQFINRKAIRNNRGGQSKNRQETYQVKATCMLPYIQMIVRPDGKLSLCCNDALGKNTLGDLNSESIMEAWNNKNYQSMRKAVLKSRQNIEFCKYCDNYASLNTEGNNIFSKKQWKEAWIQAEAVLEYV